MIKLMLVDDHAMLREGLRSKFEQCNDIDVVGEAEDGETLLEMLSSLKPDVIILDIKLPDANGISLIKQVKEVHPYCKVITLTMFDHVRYALHALECGADGFIVKGSPFEELLQAVRDVRRNKTYVSASMAPKLIDRVKRGKHAISLDNLSAREFEALVVLSSGLSLKQAAERMGVSEKTVSTYRARFMEKLRLANNTDLIRFALESGLLH
jgi:DNA-binding NarL/FixJ family response regulator